MYMTWKLPYGKPNISFIINTCHDGYIVHRDELGAFGKSICI